MTHMIILLLFNDVYRTFGNLVHVRLVVDSFVIDFNS
jgi:hypothetical protein